MQQGILQLSLLWWQSFQNSSLNQFLSLLPSWSWSSEWSGSVNFPVCRRVLYVSKLIILSSSRILLGELTIRKTNLIRYNIPEAMEFVGILGMSMWLTAFLFTPKNKHLVCYQDENLLRLGSTNTDILLITKNKSLRMWSGTKYLKYTGHVCRCPNTTLTRKMMFAKSRHDPHKRNPWTNIAKSFKLMSPLSRQRGLHKIRVVLLHLSTMQSPVQLHGNRYKVWRILTVLYCYLHKF